MNAFEVIGSLIMFCVVVAVIFGIGFFVAGPLGGLVALVLAAVLFH